MQSELGSAALVPTVATVHRVLERHGRTAARPGASPLPREPARDPLRSAQRDLDGGLQGAIPDRGSDSAVMRLPGYTPPGWRRDGYRTSFGGAEPVTRTMPSRQRRQPRM